MSFHKPCIEQKERKAPAYWTGGKAYQWPQVKKMVVKLMSIEVDLIQAKNKFLEGQTQARTQSDLNDIISRLNKIIYHR